MIGLFSKIEGYQASENIYWSGAFRTGLKPYANISQPIFAQPPEMIYLMTHKNCIKHILGFHTPVMSKK